VNCYLPRSLDHVILTLLNKVIQLELVAQLCDSVLQEQFSATEVLSSYTFYLYVDFKSISFNLHGKIKIIRFTILMNIKSRIRADFWI